MEYDYKIVYRKGSANGKANYLSCNAEYCDKEGGANHDNDKVAFKFQFGGIEVSILDSTNPATGPNAEPLGISGFNLNALETESLAKWFIEKCASSYSAKEKEELQSLAKLVIDKLKADTKGFMEEAEKRGYCKELIKKI